MSLPAVLPNDSGAVDNATPWYVRLIKLQPSLVRAALVAVLAIIAQVLGKTVVSDATVDAIINALTAISPLLAGFLIRPGVTANARVIAYQPDPVNDPHTVVTGQAAPPPDLQLNESDVAAVVEDAGMDISHEEIGEAFDHPDDTTDADPELIESINIEQDLEDDIEDENVETEVEDTSEAELNALVANQGRDA